MSGGPDDDLAYFITEEDLPFLYDLDFSDGPPQNGRRGPQDVNFDDLQNPGLDIHALFCHFNTKYFYGKLSVVEVKWSARMTLCAGLCEYKNGVCVVKLSEKLLQFRPQRDVIDTLLHEMIHAFMFVTQNNRDHDAHGEEFVKWMTKINSCGGGHHVTVFHNYHDEVNNFRVHWWECNKCKRICKRAMNRPPGPTDPWFASHQAKCGGVYIKIKEPEDYGKKKKGKKRKRDAKEDEQEKDVEPKNSIKTYFPASKRQKTKSTDSEDKNSNDEPSSEISEPKTKHRNKRERLSSNDVEVIDLSDKDGPDRREDLRKSATDVPRQKSTIGEQIQELNYQDIIRDKKANASAAATAATSTADSDDESEEIPLVCNRKRRSSGGIQSEPKLQRIEEANETEDQAPVDFDLARPRPTPPRPASLFPTSPTKKEELKSVEVKVRMPGGGEVRRSLPSSQTLGSLRLQIALDLALKKEEVKLLMGFSKRVLPSSDDSQTLSALKLAHTTIVVEKSATGPAVKREPEPKVNRLTERSTRPNSKPTNKPASSGGATCMVIEIDDEDPLLQPPPAKRPQTGNEMTSCPVCGCSIALRDINRHLDNGCA